MWGNMMENKSEIQVPHLAPGQVGNMEVEMQAPLEPGSWKYHDVIAFWCSL